MHLTISNNFLKVFCKSLCILFASSLPFLFSLHGDFVFDDSETIVNNPDVYSEPWKSAFTNDYWGVELKSNYSHKSYRPLTILSFRFNAFLNNGIFEAVQFKITNLILHITCCFIVWRTFESILNDLGIRKGNKWPNDIAFLATLMFAVHPVHVEAVSGIVGRADVLAANTFFLAFLFYKKSMTPSKAAFLHLFIAVLLSCTSMLFKENGITVLGFCLCYELITVGASINKSVISNGEICKKHLCTVLRMIFTVFAIFALLYVRWMVMGGMMPEFKPIDNPAAFSQHPFTKIATFNYIYFLNVLLHIWPQWLCYDWSMGCVSLIKTEWDFRFLCVLSMYLYGIFILIAMCRGKNKQSMKILILLAILLAVIPFLPASNIFYPVGFVIAERILYIPSAGYCLLIAIGYQKLRKKTKGILYKLCTSFFCLLMLILGLRTWQRSEDWRNEYQLFLNGLSVCPNNAKVRYNVAKAVDSKNNASWAIQEYKEAIRLYPDYYQAMNNLGNLLRSQQRYGEAKYYLQTAIAVKRDFPVAWMNLGIVLLNLKRYEEAEKAYKTALDYRKNFADCYYNLANLYLETNKTEAAKDNLLRAIGLNSTHVLAWNNLLAFLDNTEQMKIAMAIIPHALRVLPDAPSVHFNIANIYGKMSLFGEAEKHFKRAIELFGNKVQAIHYSNLGVLYHRWKKYRLAIKMYKSALKIDPQFKSAHINLQSVREILKNLEK